VNHKDLLNILDFATKGYLELPNGVRLDGMTRALSDKELVVVAYYQAVIDYLLYKNILTLESINAIKLITVDSEPETDDYVY
jgi:hypothetical protein